MNRLRTIFSKVRLFFGGRSSQAGGSDAAKPGKYGLVTLYEPTQPAAVAAEIIFIHGLGGGTRKTWSYSADPNHYWPQSWLPSDPSFKDVRIRSFGYDAGWTEWRPSILNVHDFGRSLLAELKSHPSIRLDGTPIILVGHNMGGCVAKQAYILAHRDPSCQDLARRIRSIFFLGTPHRVGDLTYLLKTMLAIAGFKRPFFEDLSRGSSTLASINDGFRHYAADLHLSSFYETLPVPHLNKIVVDKTFSSLGYPKEEITPMNADHRHLCKFESREDPNYRLLRNALHSVVDDIRISRREAMAEQFDSSPPALPPNAHSRLRKFLDVDDSVEDDLNELCVRKETGSCRWLTDMAAFLAWEERVGPQVFWLTGRPGAGKSVLSGHVADRLKSSSANCSYFFFRNGIKGKSTLGSCFRSLAYQMATKNGYVCNDLIRLAEQETELDRENEAQVWRKIFTNAIFKSSPPSPHYWIIDGIDECDDFKTIFTNKLFTALPDWLRVFAASRDLEEIRRGRVSLGPRVSEYTMTTQDTANDISLFLSARLEQLGKFNSSKERSVVRSRISQKSGGMFLWVHLVTHGMENVWTAEDMEGALDSVPRGLHDLYHRLLDGIVVDTRNKELAKSILTWVTLASRPLSGGELQCAVKLDTGRTLLNPTRAIPDICSQLVFFDRAGYAHILHETARQFLSSDLDSELAIPEAESRSKLSILMLRYLSQSLPQSPGEGPLPSTYHPNMPASSTSCFTERDHILLRSCISSSIFDHIQSSVPGDEGVEYELGLLRSRVYRGSIPKEPLGTRDELLSLVWHPSYQTPLTQHQRLTGCLDGTTGIRWAVGSITEALVPHDINVFPISTNEMRVS